MSEPEAVAMEIIAQRLTKAERDLDYLHTHRRNVDDIVARVEKVEALVVALRNDHEDYTIQMRIVTDGYETIIHEVRETRASVETLFQRQAEAHLSAVERHAGLMNWLMRGVFAVVAVTVALAGLQAVLTGDTLQTSLLNLLRGLIG